MSMSTLRWAEFVEAVGTRVAQAVIDENRDDWTSAGHLSVIRLRCHEAMMRAYAKSAGGA